MILKYTKKFFLLLILVLLGFLFFYPSNPFFKPFVDPITNESTQLQSHLHIDLLTFPHKILFKQRSFFSSINVFLSNLPVQQISDSYTGDEFTADELSSIDTFIENEIANGFPGAVLLILYKGEVVKETAYGSAQIYNGLEKLTVDVPMTTETLFDLASLTKSFATTLSILKLENEGKMNSDDLLYSYFPEFQTPEQKTITIASLLTHTSGLDVSFPFYKPNHFQYGNEFYSRDPETALSMIHQLPLAYPPMTSSLYSDLGYLLLGKTIEKVVGTSLDDYTYNEIYQPLGLKSTFYLPLEKGISTSSIAGTERLGNTRDGRYDWEGIRTYPLIGEVHDELAYYTMQGVSGHAGVFSTAHDLAQLCQLFLNGGTYQHQTFFTPNLLEKYLKPSSIDSNYLMGFDSGLAPLTFRRYGLMPSEEAYGKTGWTGTMVLIDPAVDLSIILLTNKRHTAIQDNQFVGSDFETGNYAAIVTQIYEALLNHPSYTLDSIDESVNTVKKPIELGIDQFEKYKHLFDQKKVGLITNGSGKNTKGLHTIDLLHLSTDLTALFSPEHGIRGEYEAGVWVEDTIDAPTGLPVYSLYNETKAPTPEMLQNIDIMAYDIQDVGVRMYTYIYTLISSMEACAKQNIPFVVFDRPNPTGGLISGNLLEPEFESSIGKFALPIQYGLTVGELALYLNEQLSLGCDLTVIPMNGWTHSGYYSDYACSFTAPSPNMKTIQTAYAYPATVFIEGTNVSEGRGTDYPFEIIGAPFINPYTLADSMNTFNLDGVEFVPTSFIPTKSKYAKQLCFGVRLIITDPAYFDAVQTGLSLVYQLYKEYGNLIEFKPILNLIAGTDLISLLENETLESMIHQFQVPPRYAEQIKPYLMYP